MLLVYMGYTGMEFISLAAVGYTVVVHVMDRFLVTSETRPMHQVYFPPPLKQKFLDGTLPQK